MAAQIAVHQKWSNCRPQWVVCSVIQAVIHSISALTTIWNRPIVRMYSGIDKIWTIGLMNALTRPKITPTTKMIPMRSNLVSPPTKRIPWTNSVTTHRANPVSAARMRKGPMSVSSGRRSAVR